MASGKSTRRASSRSESPESTSRKDLDHTGTGMQPDERAGQSDFPQRELTPLDYLLSIVRDESQDRPARVDAAKAAAPYCHARLSSLDHRGGLTLTYEQALEELD